MLQEFKDWLQSRFPELRDGRLLLACSGGIDSMVLVHLCRESQLQFSIAHCNFKLRGKQSDEDEKFVHEWAADHKIRLHITSFDTNTYAQKEKLSIQMAARKLRYEWFEQLLKKEGYKCVLTAHHLDDNLETFLINLSRGTGLEGLTGIPEKTGIICRPLLPFSRAQIEAHAKSQNLSWREDASNKDIKYLRNKIRKQLVPVLKELHPTFLANFSNTLMYLSGNEAVLDSYRKSLKRKFFKKEKDIIKIPIAVLEELAPLKPHIYLLFKTYGFTEWNDVAGLLNASSGKEVRSKTHRLLKDREVLLLQKISATEDEKQELPAAPFELKSPVHLVIEKVDAITETAKEILYVDKETLNPKLIVRKWKKGDYFYPLGMKGKKKLSKFFKDEKTDQISKERQWLLCSGDDVVWVIGKRADDRYKVRKKTNEILKISWQE